MKLFSATRLSSRTMGTIKAYTTSHRSPHVISQRRYTNKFSIQQMNGWKKQLFAPDEGAPGHIRSILLSLYLQICMYIWRVRACVCAHVPSVLCGLVWMHCVQTIHLQSAQVTKGPFECWMSKRKIISSSHDLPQTICCRLNISCASDNIAECALHKHAFQIAIFGSFDSTQRPNGCAHPLANRSARVHDANHWNVDYMQN